MTAGHVTRWAGFNLVEMIVASVILSGSVLALAAISTNAVTDTTLNRHYEVAAAVIDEQLSMIDYMGIAQFLKLEKTEGVNEDVEPSCQWQVSTEYQGVDNLYSVTITVTWIERNRPYSLTAQTMLDGTGVAAATTETATQ
jgi:type II secretory pathway pseudopilin PulG